MPKEDLFGQGISIAALTDAPDAETLATNIANGIAGNSVMRFDSASERTATLTGDAAPAAGMLSWLRDVKALYLYDGAAWMVLPTLAVLPYTPTVTNGGSVTWATGTGGWAMQLGPIVMVNAFMLVNAAGSGSGIVGLTMPTNVDRSRRQALTLHSESIGSGGNASSHIGGGEVVFLTSGSGNVSDRIRNDEGGSTGRENNILGNDLLAGGSLTVQGWYLKG